MTLAVISRNWFAALTAILAACYIVLGATAFGIAGVLGIVGGVLVLIAIVASPRLPAISPPLVLGAAVLPFAILIWWSIVTPLLAIPNARSPGPETNTLRSDVGNHAEARR